MGINLQGANRVILLDVGFNPCHEEQAIARVFRYGQTKPVYIYRLLTSNTVEQVLYKIHMQKIILSKEVVDRKNMHKLVSKIREYFTPINLQAEPQEELNWPHLESLDPICYQLYHDLCYEIKNINPHQSLLTTQDPLLSNQEKAEAEFIVRQAKSMARKRAFKVQETSKQTPIKVQQQLSLLELGRMNQKKKPKIIKIN